MVAVMLRICTLIHLHLLCAKCCTGRSMLWAGRHSRIGTVTTPLCNARQPWYTHHAAQGVFSLLALASGNIGAHGGSLLITAQGVEYMDGSRLSKPTEFHWIALTCSAVMIEGICIDCRTGAYVAATGNYKMWSCLASWSDSSSTCSLYPGGAGCLTSSLSTPYITDIAF